MAKNFSDYASKNACMKQNVTLQSPQFSQRPIYMLAKDPAKISMFHCLRGSLRGEIAPILKFQQRFGSKPTNFERGSWYTNH